MHIVEGGLDDPRVVALLDAHVTRSRAETARGSAHALDPSGLRSPDVTFWSAWRATRSSASVLLSEDGEILRVPADDFREPMETNVYYAPPYSVSKAALNALTRRQRGGSGLGAHGHGRAFGAALGRARGGHDRLVCHAPG